MSRASLSLSAQITAVVIMMLSFTNWPTGVASVMAFLYERMCGSISGMGDTVKPSTPMPCRAAFSYVGGFPAATHMAGWLEPPPYGLGRMLRLGVENATPSWE